MKNQNVTISQKGFAKRNPYKFRLNESDMETPKGVSLTVQDDSYSIKDIYEKFTNGLDLGIERNAYFNEDADHDDPDESKIQGMDLADRQDLLEETKARARRNLDLLKQMDADKATKKDTPKTMPPNEDKDDSGDDLRNDNEEPKSPTPRKEAKREGQKSATPS